MHAMTTRPRFDYRGMGILTARQHEALMAWESGNQSATKVARMLGCSYSTAYNLVETLKNKGYIPSGAR